MAWWGRKDSPRGDATWRQAFGDDPALTDALAVLARAFPSPTATVARDAVAVADRKGTRSAIGVIREEKSGGLPALPAVMGYVALVGPSVDDAYDGYGLREAMFTFRDLRTLARSRCAGAPPELGEALRTLLRFLEEEVEPAIAAGVRTWHPLVRRGAIDVLAEMTDLEAASEALGWIASLEVPPDDADADYARGEALRALQRVNHRRRPPAPPAPPPPSAPTVTLPRDEAPFPERAADPAPTPFSIDGLIEVLAREVATGSASQRQSAMRILTELGAAALAATDAVWALAASSDPDLEHARGEALRWLARWHGPAKAAPEPESDPGARSALVALATDDEDPTVRAAAVQALARVASVRSDLLPVARAAAADPDPRVRLAAIDLLERIGG